MFNKQKCICAFYKSLARSEKWMSGRMEEFIIRIKHLFSFICPSGYPDWLFWENASVSMGVHLQWADQLLAFTGLFHNFFQPLHVSGHAELRS